MLDWFYLGTAPSRYQELNCTPDGVHDAIQVKDMLKEGKQFFNEPSGLRPTNGILDKHGLFTTRSSACAYDLDTYQRVCDKFKIEHFNDIGHFMNDQLEEGSGLHPDDWVIAFEFHD